ncbi:MAG: hypothetical protein PHN72_02865 [Bacilli bacterium]|nr:hypothetical protein [Bacilli bacterium]
MFEGKKVRKKKNIYSFKRVLLNKKSYAKKFAQKNQALYDLLMECFNANIETVKCNPGKETQNMIKKPYITFRINDYNHPYLEKLVSAVAKEHIIITFSFNHLGHKTVTFKTLRDDTSMFEEIQQVFYLKKSLLKIKKS